MRGIGIKQITKQDLSLNYLRKLLFCLVIVGAPFALIPSISLPFEGFVSFRVGLYQLVSAFFVLSMLPIIWQQRKKIYADKSVAIPVAIISVIAISSPFRSENSLRSLLLVLSLGLLILVAISSWYFARQILTNKTWQTCIQFAGWSAVVVCAIGLGQLIASSLGIDNSSLGLCKGCGEEVFGFARINGFAAEPQFLASSLLPFLLGSLALFITGLSKKTFLVLFATSLTISLTLSRGGYIAAGFGVIVVLAMLISKGLTSYRQAILGVAVIVGSFCMAISILVAAATLRYHSQNPAIAQDTFFTIVDHVSLGTIDLTPKPLTPVATDIPAVVIAPVEETSAEVFISPGEITASQTDRQSAARTALSWWREKNLSRQLFGLGLGNLGSFAHAQNPSVYPLSFTVYMQYVYMLVEMGLLGLGAFVFLILLCVHRAYSAFIKHSGLWTAVLTGCIGAFAVQFFFFGSYINTIHIWLYIGLALASPHLPKTLMSKKSE